MRCALLLAMAAWVAVLPPPAASQVSSANPARTEFARWQQHLDPTDPLQRGSVPWLPSLAGGLAESRATGRPLLIVASDEVFGST